MQLMMPVFWASEEGSLTKSLANEFKKKVYVAEGIEGGVWAGVGLGGKTLQNENSRVIIDQGFLTAFRKPAYNGFIVYYIILPCRAGFCDDVVFCGAGDTAMLLPTTAEASCHQPQQTWTSFELTDTNEFLCLHFMLYEQYYVDGLMQFLVIM